MKRRFLPVFCLLFLALFLAVKAQAKQIVLKVAYTNVPEHPQGEAFPLFKKAVEERSRGEIKVELYDNGKFGNYDSNMQGLQMGVLALAAESTSNYSVYNPKLQIFDIPYLVPSFAAAERILDGKIGQELSDALARNNVFAFGYMHQGFRSIFSNRPIRRLEDARGLKIRTTPSKVEIATMKALGMNPTPVAWGEVYTALQQKTVDGINIDFNLAYVNKFYEVCKYVTLTRTSYYPHMILMSKRFWQTLTPQQQKIVRTAFDECVAFERKRCIENVAAFRKQMEAKGLTVIELPPEELARWQKAVADIGGEFENIIPHAFQEEVAAAVRQ